ncbi:MAG TPA: SagB/ThcOx family dehydrogenase, partial [Candidatus Eremiobacteraeota bacterium]|nr:SagB/ThcOx family dehydrogenase [Candidatus Eremiobacteraeota bacterium]
MDLIETHRKFLRNDLREEALYIQSDQSKKFPPPLMEKPCSENAILIELIPPELITIGKMPLINVINKRRSRRQFEEIPLTLEELSFLLWATQGVKEVLSSAAALKTVPSAGARHPFETYLFINRISGINKGLYRYLPLEHKLCFLYEDEKMNEKINDACMGQNFAGDCAVTFIWTVIPYRTEWRYHVLSSKIILLDAGHICQNLYLASESIGAGTCAIGAYLQSKMDAILGVDGKDEFTVYL